VRKKTARVLDKEVEMVGHQTEGVDTEASVNTDGGEYGKEHETIESRTKQRATVDAAVGDVMQAVGLRTVAPITITGTSTHAPLSNREG